MRDWRTGIVARWLNAPAEECARTPLGHAEPAQPYALRAAARAGPVDASQRHHAILPRRHGRTAVPQSRWRPCCAPFVPRDRRLPIGDPRREGMGMGIEAGAAWAEPRLSVSKPGDPVLVTWGITRSRGMPSIYGLASRRRDTGGDREYLSRGDGYEGDGEMDGNAPRGRLSHGGAAIRRPRRRSGGNRARTRRHTDLGRRAP